MPELALHTRGATQVANDHVTLAPTAFDLATAQRLAAKYPAAIRRPTQVSLGYNCHGLTFAARRTEITHSAEVRKIITEDGYVKINKDDAVPGDIVIHISLDGSIEHSGIVIEVPNVLPKIPKVLSKWGLAEEFIHPFNYSPYSNNIEFYRLVR